MSGARQVFLGFFMALLFSAIVLGSLSLSLVETGYMLGQVPEPESPDVDLSGAVFLSMAGDESESNAPVSRKEITVLVKKPTAAPCVPPQNWIKILVRPDYTTLKSLAHLTDSNVELLKEGNCLMADTLTVGSELYVPKEPMQPTKAPPRPTYQPQVYYPTPYPTVQSWPTLIPWVPTMTPVTPPPTQPPTLPPTLPPSPMPTAQPPTPFPTAQPTAPNPAPTNPPPTNPPPTSPPPTSPPPTSPPPTSPPPTSPPPTSPPPTALPPTAPPPTSPPQPTPVPPTPQPQPTVQPLPQPTAPPEPQPTEPRLPPPPQPTALPPIAPTPPPEQQPPAPTIVLPGSFLTSSPS